MSAGSQRGRSTPPRGSYWDLLSECVPASSDATASVQLVIFCKLLELSAVTHKKVKTNIPAGTEQEPDATEKVTRERGLSVFAGIGNIA